MSEFLYFNDNGSSKIFEQLERIKKWEGEQNAK